LTHGPSSRFGKTNFPHNDGVPKSNNGLGVRKSRNPFEGLANQTGNAPLYKSVGGGVNAVSQNAVQAMATQLIKDANSA
jgi:hypothetical protein